MRLASVITTEIVDSWERKASRLNSAVYCVLTFVFIQTPLKRTSSALILVSTFSGQYHPGQDRANSSPKDRVKKSHEFMNPLGFIGDPGVRILGSVWNSA